MLSWSEMPRWTVVVRGEILLDSVDHEQRFGYQLVVVVAGLPCLQPSRVPVLVFRMKITRSRLIWRWGFHVVSIDAQRLKTPAVDKR